MNDPRLLPLYDADHRPGTWNERMVPGEYAVHYSSFEGDANTVPHCTVFASLEQAEAFARQEVERRPALRCTIFDHHGFNGRPLREIRGREFKDGEISARFRRWVGSHLFFGGLFLTILDWVNDFQLSWPAMIGTRMLFPGVVLLGTEAVILTHARSNKRRLGATQQKPRRPERTA